MLKEFQKNSIVITDTSCFILLDKIDALFILSSLYSNVFTTPEIASEFGKPLPIWVKIKSAANHDLQEIYAQKVDRGEASAIALAQEFELALLIIDDLQARKFASSLKLNHIGTLGILLLAKQSGVIILLKPYFDKIKNTDFRAPSAFLESILRQAGE